MALVNFRTDERTQRALEELTADSPERLGRLVGHVSRTELGDINDALRLALKLD